MPLSFDPDDAIEISELPEAGATTSGMFVPVVDEDDTSQSASGTNYKLPVSLLGGGGGTMAAQDADSVTITGGSITGATGVRGENRVTFSNANATCAATTRYLAQIGTMSASRTVTLPAANALPAGAEIIIADQSGTVTSANTIVIARAASDTINGATSAAISAAYGFRRLVSDGISSWTFDGGVLRSVDINTTINPIDTQTFLGSSGTWTKPTGNYRWARICGVGAGAGGGSGRKGLAAAGLYGGGGGGHGGYLDVVVPFASLPSTLTITIGAVGTGGAAQTSNSTNGNAGTAGASSTISGSGFDTLTVLGSFAGSAGTTTSGTAGPASGGQLVSVAGGASSITVAAAVGNYAVNAAGGAGGGATVAGVFLAGGGGRSGLPVGFAAISAGLTDGANGSAAASPTLSYTLPPSGRSGGGGASSVLGNAGSAGASAGWGAGGSGGGAAVDSVGNSGAGADGRPGAVIIQCY